MYPAQSAICDIQSVSGYQPLGFWTTCRVGRFRPMMFERRFLMRQYRQNLYEFYFPDRWNPQLVDRPKGDLRHDHDRHQQTYRRT